LLKQLGKTGFPLEVEVSDLLETDWIVSNNEAYVDEETRITREIDIFAIHSTETVQLAFVNPPRLFLATDLAVECKRSETHAWVFLTRNKVAPPGLGSGQTLDFLQVLSGGSQSFLGRSNQQLELPKLHYDTTERIAHTGTSIRLMENERSKGPSSQKHDRDEIFEARNQLMKFSSSFLNGYRNRFAMDATRRDVALLFLTIVFDGQLYEARVENHRWSISPSNHVLLTSGRYSRTTGGYESYMIDVVTKQRFPEHAKLLSRDVGLVSSDVTWRYQDLIAKADQAVKTLPGTLKDPTPT
jgi:hypothetical protein